VDKADGHHLPHLTHEESSARAAFILLENGFAKVTPLLEASGLSAAVAHRALSKLVSSQAELFYPGPILPIPLQNGVDSTRSTSNYAPHASTLAYEDWVPLARLVPARICFPVEWLLSPDTPEHEDTIERALTLISCWQRRHNDPGDTPSLVRTAGNMY
jgi:hypothetical protein